MKIKDYGKHTVVFYTDRTTKKLEGHRKFPIEKKGCIVKGYIHYHHGRNIEAFGETWHGWIMSEIKSKGVVNSRVVKGVKTK